MENVSKDALADAIASQADLSKKDAVAAIEAFTDTVTKELQNGNKITLTGFGTFKTSDRAAREGRNPQTGEKLQIPAMTVPKFTAGKALKDAIR